MKKLVALSMSLIILMSLFLICLPMAANAESLYIRKIVSVVYDDSGSMEGDKWAFANYAMQAFCGMLNSEDQLFITYMHPSELSEDYEPETVDLSSGGIQSSVDSIRNHSDKGGTPFKAVDVAFDKLKATDDSNVNTQYWLVVITDGSFDTVQTTEVLNDKLSEYVDETMPNGTKPQITYLAIGENAVSADGDEQKGIFSYSCKAASEIISTMFKVADRVSGRTRLDSSNMKLINDNTIQVSSSIPLLNIAVLSQKTDAKITKTVYSNEVEIPVSRYASLSYPGYSELVGGAYLLGDSQNVIGSGTYNITFDKKISLDNIVVLFEPALEMRMKISVNGQELDNNSDIKNTTEGDKISVSCKLYEVGTDKEISPDLLPSNTSFDISIFEDGNLADHVSGKNMELKDYELKNIETKILASVQIENFNPIEYSKKFTPGKYVPKTVYTISSEFENGKKSIKYDYISSNKDMKIKFTINADGVPLTDANTVKQLNPQIEILPDGNSGTVLIENDGKISLTPNTAKLPAEDVGSFDVNIKCTLNDGTSATETYTVLVAEYEVIAEEVEDSIKKNEFFGNKIGASFYITKDGQKLDKSQVEKNISMTLNEVYSHLNTDVFVEDDGTIKCIPSDNEERIIDFWNWWGNWWYYFNLEGSDVTVKLDHPYGNAEAVIDVTDADFDYLFWYVYAPLILEIILLVLIIAYIVRYVTKPRFASNAALYVGYITRSMKGLGTHTIELREVSLKQYNKFSNLWNPFKKLTVSVDGIRITAIRGNKISCEEPFPWFSSAVIPRDRTVIINSPKDIVDYCSEHNGLVIKEILPTMVLDEQDRNIEQDESVYYCVGADLGTVSGGVGQMEVIKESSIFCYSVIEN